MAVVIIQSVSMYVGVSFCSSSVFLLILIFLIVDVFPSVLVCDLNLFQLNLFMNIEQGILLLPLGTYFTYRIIKCDTM